MMYDTCAFVISDDSVVSQQESQEKTVCMSMGAMINMCHELVQSAIPVGPVTDHMLKSLTHLYTTLTNLTKMVRVHSF